MKRKLLLGTRGSALARTQSQWVAEQLLETTGWNTELRIIVTTGDRITDRPLKEVGGKGLFTKEVEEALLSGEVDYAVHSMKDLPSEMPAGLTLGCIPQREDPRDALVGMSLHELSKTHRVGTGSTRRAALLRSIAPDTQILGIRGNVDTRIRKMHEGSYDAIVLAAAGLRRLGRSDEIGSSIPVETMIPAVGQGALAVQCRESDSEMLRLLSAIHCAKTSQCVMAERAFLREFGGGCSVPAACHAFFRGENEVVIYSAWENNEGKLLRGEQMTTPEAAVQVATEMAARLLKQNH